MGRLKVHWGQDLSFLFVFYPWSEFLPLICKFLMVNGSKILFTYTVMFVL